MPSIKQTLYNSEHSINQKYSNRSAKLLDMWNLRSIFIFKVYLDEYKFYACYISV